MLNQQILNGKEISGQSIGIYYFDVKEATNIIGISRSTLYKKYLNNPELNINRYYTDINNTGKVYLSVDDINKIKNLESVGKKEPEQRFSAEISFGQPTVDGQEELRKTQLDYANAMASLSACRERISDLIKDKEELKINLCDAQSNLTKTQTLLDQQQQLSLRDKAVIDDLSKQLSEAKQHLLLAAQSEATLKSDLEIKNQSLEKLESNIISKDKIILDCRAELELARKQLNNIESRGLMGKLKFAFTGK